ncbi:MAG: hypothetical protein H6981_07140 [Gammaproteobacteria bacterium]|nr:hypothetical protein [Gammaproteobacteria bacterium]
MRDDPLNRTRVLRGAQLPHAKLDEATVAKVHEAVALRTDLRRRAGLLSIARIAESLGVHVRTIDRITAGENWTHVADATQPI